MRVDTAALRAAAKKLREDAANDIGQAYRATGNTEGQYVTGFAFDDYGSGPAYRAVAEAWRGELAGLGDALRQLADAMDAAAANYDRADKDSAARLGTVR